MTREAYKAFIEIDGKWELVGFAYDQQAFNKRLVEIKKQFPNCEIRTNIGSAIF